MLFALTLVACGGGGGSTTETSSSSSGGTTTSGGTAKVSVTVPNVGTFDAPEGVTKMIVFDFRDGVTETAYVSDNSGITVTHGNGCGTCGGVAFWVENAGGLTQVSYSYSKTNELGVIVSEWHYTADFSTLSEFWGSGNDSNVWYQKIQSGIFILGIK